MVYASAIKNFLSFLNTGGKTYTLNFIRYKVESAVVHEAAEPATTCIKGRYRSGMFSFFLSVFIYC